MGAAWMAIHLLRWVVSRLNTSFDRWSHMAKFAVLVDCDRLPLHRIVVRCICTSMDLDLESSLG